MSKKHSILMIGSYGCGNRGDDAILASIVHAFQDCEFYVTCGNYEDISHTIPVHTIRCRLNEGFSLRIFFSIGVSCMCMFFRLLRSDALFFGGGSIIHDLTPYNLPFMFLWHRIAKFLGKKVIYVCVGVGPLNSASAKRFAGRVLKTADCIFVRDERGRELCKTCGVAHVKMACDAVFGGFEQVGVDGTLRSHALEKNAYIAVTGCAWFQSSNFWTRNGIDFSDEIRRYASVLEALYREYHQPLLFVPTVFHDALLYDRLRPLLNNIPFLLLPARHSYAEMDAVIGAARLLIGVRMHSIIFAIRNSVPIVALIYDQKVMELLRLANLTDYSVPLEQASPDTNLKICRQIDANRNELRQKMQETSDTFRVEVLEAFADIRMICGW